VPQIVTFIQKIIDNGLAYAANNSVYFDVNGFQEEEGKIVIYWLNLVYLIFRNPR